MGFGEKTDRVGRWVRIQWCELAPADRSLAIPADTRAVPFDVWVNGWLRGSGSLGDTVQVETVTGRTLSGVLVEETPGYDHTFGRPFLPLKYAGAVAVSVTRGGRA